MESTLLHFVHLSYKRFKVFNLVLATSETHLHSVQVDKTILLQINYSLKITHFCNKYDKQQQRSYYCFYTGRDAEPQAI